MATIKLYGHLKRFGSEFKLDVKDTAEAIRALCLQIPQFRTALQQGLFRVRVGKNYLDNRFLEKGMFYRLKKQSAVHILPVLKGAKRGGIFQAILGGVLIGAAFLLGPMGFAVIGETSALMIGVMGGSMLLGGVAQMLAKTPSMDTKLNEKEKRQSTSFSNLGNLIAQGRPIPLAYGRILTGSLIISQGIETVDVVEQINKVGQKQANSGRFFSNKGK